MWGCSSAHGGMEGPRYLHRFPKETGAAAVKPSNRGVATKLTTQRLQENAAPATNQRKYGLSSITADNHLSSCPFLNAFVAFSSTTLISFVPRVYSFLAPVLDCNNDLRKQCFFLFSIPVPTLTASFFSAFPTLRSPFGVCALWAHFSQLKYVLSINSNCSQRTVNILYCFHVLVKQLVSILTLLKLEIHNSVKIKNRELWRLAGSLVVFASVFGCF